MILLNENIVYEFNVMRNESTLSATDDAPDEFQIDLRFRKFHPQSRLPEIELQRSIELPRAGSESSIEPLMEDILREFEVPERLRGDMALHFKFHLDRMSRLNFRRRGIIPVVVNVEVKVISPEMAAQIHSRMEAERRENHRSPMRREAEVAATPAKKAAVEALVRERVLMSDEERECVICLESFGMGMEVIRMPCLHVYHKDCILQWLERTHFCPFCRFKLPY